MPYTLYPLSSYNPDSIPLETAVPLPTIPYTGVPVGTTHTDTGIVPAGTVGHGSAREPREMVLGIACLIPPGPPVPYGPPGLPLPVQHLYIPGYSRILCCNPGTAVPLPDTPDTAVSHTVWCGP